MLGHPGYALPTVEQAIALNIRLGSLTNSQIRCAGVSLNTAALGADEAERLMAAETARLGLPVADPLRGGQALAAMIDNILMTE